MLRSRKSGATTMRQDAAENIVSDTSPTQIRQNATLDRFSICAIYVVVCKRALSLAMRNFGTVPVRFFTSTGLMEAA